MEDLNKRLNRVKDLLNEAEYIVIGGGAGLSAAAGLTYSGERFLKHFADFKERYGFNDMYSGTFYPFKTKEELWAHWARHIDVNLYHQEATPLYQNLFDIVKHRNYFVITTNVESQFIKAGFDENKLFEVQGNYGFLQCAKACHQKLYPNKAIIEAMINQTKSCRIPSNLIPKCPVCQGEMDVNLRHNQYFVQDNRWYEMNDQYIEFLHRTKNANVVFFEFGVGFNTPSIIRYPFEQMTFKNPHATLIRFNKDYPDSIKENRNKTITFNEDIELLLNEIRNITNA